jgi:hypothetical protein
MVFEIHDILLEPLARPPQKRPKSIDLTRCPEAETATLP